MPSTSIIVLQRTSPGSGAGTKREMLAAATGSPYVSHKKVMDLLRSMPLE